MKSSAFTFGRKQELPGDIGARRGQLPKLSLVYYPNPILRAICRPVDRFDSALRELVQDMFSLMDIHKGIGLAGPQVAVEHRVLVCAIQGRQLCLTNPEIQDTHLCVPLFDTTRAHALAAVGYALKS